MAKITNDGIANEMALHTLRGSMFREKPRNYSPPWWSKHIHSLKVKYTRAKRLMQRARRRNLENFREYYIEYKNAGNLFRSTIQESKYNSFSQLCKEANINICDEAMAIALRIFCKRYYIEGWPTDAKVVRDFIKSLFSLRPSLPVKNTRMGHFEVSLSTITELSSMCKYANQFRTLTPIETSNSISEEERHVLINTFQECILDSIFPRHWDGERHKLILISTPEDASPHIVRSAYFLGSINKMLETIMLDKLLEKIKVQHTSSSFLLGFRHDVNFMDGLSKITENLEINHGKINTTKNTGSLEYLLNIVNNYLEGKLM